MRQLPEWEGRGENGGHELTDPLKKRQLDGGKLSEKDRIETPCKRNDYSFFNYLAYSLYSPLYLAGPIITFNDFMSQVGQLRISKFVLNTLLTGFIVATESSSYVDICPNSSLWDSFAILHTLHGNSPPLPICRGHI